MTKKKMKAMRSTRVAFLNCNDASLHVGDVKPTDEEREQVQAALACLQQAGLVLVPSQKQGGRGRTYVTCWRLCERAWARLRCKRRSPPNRGNHWATNLRHAPSCRFGNSSERVTIGGPGRADCFWTTWGTDMLLEALRVGGPDESVPVLTVRPRLDRWVKAAGGGQMRSHCQPPGEEGWYQVAAIATPI